ncbi:MAG: methylmalonyl Co-A mutase-associated GTPase MeaB [Methylobacteriaceae bacterium]|nr:methylmalonyl Co-A mutase-associated GTPase MeaB [Methylobacteriaceae bacterium]
MQKRLPSLATISAGGKRAVASALALIETARGTAELAALLDDAVVSARAHVTGLTGPPGVGKSTLTNALLRDWRAAGDSVAVIAVDPSSRTSGGALLGDRARIVSDPEDPHVFIRSMAARDRLGGLSDETVAAVALLRAFYDRVLVETVGIGQSEADIVFVADTVVLCIQPASGDSLQFMKAGVMELPDVVAVTKADLGAAASRARSEAEGALTLFSRDAREWAPPVVLVSAARGEGLAELNEAIARHRAHLAADGRLEARRDRQQQMWIEESIRAKFGTAGLAAARGLKAEGRPFARERAIAAELNRRLQPGK